MTEFIWDHRAVPGPDYWDFRCLECGQPCHHHATEYMRFSRWVQKWWRRVLRKLGRGPTTVPAPSEERTAVRRSGSTLEHGEADQ